MWSMTVSGYWFVLCDRKHHMGPVGLGGNYTLRWVEAAN